MNMHFAADLLSGYLDGELGADQMKNIDTHLEQCRECMADYKAQADNQHRVRTEAQRFAAPRSLRRVIADQIRGKAAFAKSRPRFTVPWWSAGAGMALTAVLAVGLTLRLGQSDYAGRLEEEITASHVRSLIGNRATDVASSDQHTVKPWFSGKLDFSPPVRDFVEEGFPLLGGRVDYVGKRQVAVLVYRRRQHLIDVYVWPADDRNGPVQDARSIGGYHIEHAIGGGMRYVSISDVSRDDLRALMSLLRRQPG